METNTGNVQYCKSCGLAGAGKFCSGCGQSYNIKRITLKKLLHDVFHFFTHLEKGFGYTVKRLVTAPGIMEREYVEGVRSRYQQPFSLFFICASINAVTRYGLEGILVKYFGSDTMAEGTMRHEYQLLLLLALMPVITFLTWVLFAKNKYNYAETGVFQLYQVSFILLFTVLTASLRLVWHNLDTAYIELPVFVLYSIISSIRFYNTSGKLGVIIRSAILTVLFFMMIQFAEDFIISLIKAKTID